MDILQSLPVIVTVLGTAYYIHRDIASDMKNHTARTDKLYEMFIDLLKEGKK
jgi:hypothetical protein